MATPGSRWRPMKLSLVLGGALLVAAGCPIVAAGPWKASAGRIREVQFDSFMIGSRSHLDLQRYSRSLCHLVDAAT